ncbi:MAG: type II toxin-antitoxin system HicB family antitoxin [Armatimonadota bacterium]
MTHTTQVKQRKKRRIKKIVARYTVLIERDEETGQYCVTVPALPGCITQGDTLEEAIANAEECIQGFIATLQDLGKPIPIEILVETEVEAR